MYRNKEMLNFLNNNYISEATKDTIEKLKNETNEKIHV